MPVSARLNANDTKRSAIQPKVLAVRELDSKGPKIRRALSFLLPGGQAR